MLKSENFKREIEIGHWVESTPRAAFILPSSAHSAYFLDTPSTQQSRPAARQHAHEVRAIRLSTLTFLVVLWWATFSLSLSTGVEVAFPLF